MMTQTQDTALMARSGTIVLAGAGRMGGALLSGWIARGMDPARIAVIEPNPNGDLQQFVTRGVRLNPSPDANAPVDALIVAVKPQTFAEAASALRGYVTASTLVVSIMAGQTIAGIASRCGGAVVRAMPNTPAAIGRGITVAVPARDVTEAQRQLADALLRATGLVEWVEDETLLDAVTAVSGSGPAYVFLLAEELARAGIEAGLPESLATTLARETVAGAGELLHRASETPGRLRENVTSPGGTTAAALGVLMADDGLRPLMIRAIAAATRRSRELAS
jgi:pyrroline-5-carboxylate reductase